MKNAARALAFAAISLVGAAPLAAQYDTNWGTCQWRMYKDPANTVDQNHRIRPNNIVVYWSAWEPLPASKPIWDDYFPLLVARYHVTEKHIFGNPECAYQDPNNPSGLASLDDAIARWGGQSDWTQLKTGIRIYNLTPPARVAPNQPASSGNNESGSSGSNGSNPSSGNGGVPGVVPGGSSDDAVVGAATEIVGMLGQMSRDREEAKQRKAASQAAAQAAEAERRRAIAAHFAALPGCVMGRAAPADLEKGSGAIAQAECAMRFAPDTQPYPAVSYAFTVVQDAEVTVAVSPTSGVNVWIYDEDGQRMHGFIAYRSVRERVLLPAGRYELMFFSPTTLTYQYALSSAQSGAIVAGHTAALANGVPTGAAGAQHRAALRAARQAKATRLAAAEKTRVEEFPATTAARFRALAGTWTFAGKAINRSGREGLDAHDYQLELFTDGDSLVGKLTYQFDEKGKTYTVTASYRQMSAAVPSAGGGWTVMLTPRNFAVSNRYKRKDRQDSYVQLNVSDDGSSISMEHGSMSPRVPNPNYETPALYTQLRRSAASASTEPVKTREDYLAALSAATADSGVQAVHAKVTAMRFYEIGPGESTPTADSSYHSAFDASQARYIGVRLDFAQPPVVAARGGKFVCQRFGPVGATALEIAPFQISAGATRMAFSPGTLGWPDPGHWTRGTWEVYCYSGGQEIAQGSYTIR